MPDGSAKPRRSKLLAVAPDDVQPKRPKIMLFGEPGIGKTWFSLDFPDCYLFDHEGGADLGSYRNKLRDASGMYFGPEQGALDFDTVIGQVEALATEKHRYRTVIFDSITKLYNAAITDEQQRLGDKDVFGASKKGPVRQMARLLQWVNRADLNAIFIAHSKDIWGKDEKGNREVVGTGPDVWDKMTYELHLVLRASKIGTGANAKRFAHIGKSRLQSFPEGDRFELSYTAFAERYGKDVIEKAVVPIILASAEQIAEVKRLLEIVKLPDGSIEKWFTKAGVEDWSEMDDATIAKVIVFLNERLK